MDWSKLPRLWMRQTKNQVAEGGRFINKVVLPVKLSDLADIEAHVMHEGKTYYDKTNEKGLGNQRQQWSTKGVQMEVNIEVMWNTHNFH